MAVALQKSDLLAHDLLIELGPQDARERDEAWRYSKTALRALSQNEFVVADGNAAVSSALRERFAWPQTQGRRVVFVNGVFSAAHSDFDAKNAAVEIRHATHGRSILAISAGAAEPLHVIYLSIAGATPSRWSAMLDVEVSGGKIHLIEQHLGDVGADVLGALTSDVRVGAGGEFGHTLISEAQDSVSLYRRTQTRDRERRHAAHDACAFRRPPAAARRRRRSCRPPRALRIARGIRARRSPACRHASSGTSRRARHRLRHCLARRR